MITAQEAYNLHVRGFSFVEIGKMLGISRGKARKLVVQVMESDPNWIEIDKKLGGTGKFKKFGPRW